MDPGAARRHRVGRCDARSLVRLAGRRVGDGYGLRPVVHPQPRGGAPALVLQPVLERPDRPAPHRTPRVRRRRAHLPSGPHPAPPRRVRAPRARLRSLRRLPGGPRLAATQARARCDRCVGMEDPAPRVHGPHPPRLPRPGPQDHRRSAGRVRIVRGGRPPVAVPGAVVPAVVHRVAGPQPTPGPRRARGHDTAATTAAGPPISSTSIARPS